MMQNFAVTNTNVNVCCFKANYRAAIYLVLVYDIIVNLVITWNLVSNVFRWYHVPMILLGIALYVLVFLGLNNPQHFKWTRIYLWVRTALNLLYVVVGLYNMIKTYPKGQCIGENCEDPHNFFYAYLFLTLFGCIGLYLSHVFSKSLIYNEARLRTKHMVLVETMQYR
eukprot:TRINITY_DN5509_c0_g1_i7.p1 TRINITY_DN5509_c0_g1~~TRINITY_DN5509_c0_g1_i7.p1  ORF type:complete len:168 (+),score=2.05 TRINITY_DN5509_c0_g1_i7:211-714(+)